jgi:glycosyltransferase involved in cell wall biosynthesis
MNEGNNKRIALFSASLRGGGAERAIMILASYLFRKGFKVDMVLAEKVGPFLSELPTGIRIIDLKKRRILFSFWRLVRYLKEEKPDVLISTMNYVNIVTLLARCLARVPTKIVIREVTVASLSKSFSDGIKIRVVLVLIRLLYPLADLIIAVSGGVAADLREYFKIPSGKIRVICDPVVDEAMLEKAGAVVAHPWFGSDRVPIVLAAGRLSKEKDYPTLFNAFAILKQRTEMRLVILGEGKERNALENMIKAMDLKSYISMPGFVENPFAYMKKADVFVLSSIVEGLSNVLVQAMAVGTPVVSTNCPSGPAEVLENGKYGPLVPVGDAESLAEAIYTVLSEPPQPEFLQEGALRFSADIICNKYLEAINNII